MLHARFGLTRAFQNSRHTWSLRGFQSCCNLVTLAIETSCDDTAVAILEKDSPLDRFENGIFPGSEDTKEGVYGRASARLLFNERITAPNTGLGGIHPLEALESHQTNLAKLIAKAVEALPASRESTTCSKAMEGAGGQKVPDFVSVTRGPGMRSNLNCGLDTAKGLAIAWQVPLLGVHHMQAHALTPRLVHAMNSEKAGDEARPKFPFLTLLVSGGHTMLLHSKGLTDHEVMATTRDIAIGDALDKCGRILLPDSVKMHATDTAFARDLSNYAFSDPRSYSSWPVPRRRAQEIDKPSNVHGWQVQAPLADTKELAFSFTSIATGIEKLFRLRQQETGGLISEEERLQFARTALGTAFEHLASRTIVGLETLQRSGQDVTTLVVSGGVAANSFLRYFLRSMLDVRGYSRVELLFPPPWLCTDNAAMIAWCGMEMYEAGFRSKLDIGSLRKWSMDSAAENNITTVPGWEQVNVTP